MECNPSGYFLSGRSLRGADIFLDEASVTATENALMAAVLAPGQTSIRNAASEPHIQELAHFLNGLGAKIEIREQCHWIPEQAILVELSIPAQTAALAESDILVDNTPTDHDRGEKPESTKVFKISDSHSFNRKTLEFSRSVAWKYI